MNKMASILKKTIFIFIITLLLGTSLIPTTQRTTYAQAPDNTNGAQAATVEWISDLALDILTLMIVNNNPVDLRDRLPYWRPTEIQDLDGKQKSDKQQRLLRWDRRPPNQILQNGFIPQVVNENLTSKQTDLFSYVTTNNLSMFVSTTKTNYKDNKCQNPWRPRTADNGVIYQYEIFAPGGIDVNESFGQSSPWPNQREVAFPGGIRTEFIRSVRELQDGRVQRVWLNPYFNDPMGLSNVSASSSTEQVQWYPNHPDGNHKDPNVPDNKNFNPDADMYGKDGTDPGGDDEPVFNGSKIIPDGQYQIKSRLGDNIAASLKENKSRSPVEPLKNDSLDNQKWDFIYDSKKDAYKIKASQNTGLLLTFDSKKSKEIMGYDDYSYSDQYWKIERTDKGFYKLRSVYDTTMLLDYKDAEGKLVGDKENGDISQEWEIDKTTYIPLEDGQYQIHSKVDSDKIADLGGVEDKPRIQIFQNYEKANQRWNFRYDKSKRAYKITSPIHSTLSIAWDSSTESNKVIGATGDGEEFYWRPEKTPDGYFILRNYKDPKMVLDLPYSNTENSNQLIVYPSTRGSNQKWSITPVDFQTIEDGEYVIASIINKNQAADLALSDNTVNTYPKYFGNNQKWKFTFNQDMQAYRVVNVNNPELAFAWDSHGSGKIFGAIGDFSDQYWRPEKTPDGYFILRNYKDPKMVLDLPDGNPGINNQLQAWEDNGTSAQKWTLQKMDTPILPDGIYNIGSDLNYKKVIENFAGHNAVIYDYMWHVTAANWELKYDSGKQAYKIYTKVSQNLGLYYQGEDKNVTIDNLDSPPDENELRKFWIIEYNDEKGAYTIRSKFDPSNAIDIERGNLENNTQIISYKNNFTVNQLWHFMPDID
ncbi:hypothetical protein COD21_31220 [Bacillus cereus]|uniref:scabin-related ADP-ribosyltransferase n=1 Tax=Bacillus cereus TaxID=1396 RepID=UPI000BFB5F6D|nr:RICIN domain-containing protein [Bacillus cereus]PGT99570.1 hypothetical protein COD21_31220 [Bacillus cereus]